MSVVIGTAGHIDHGKTALVRCLTGIDCDRLAEEKRRGITIELGFAHLDLSNGPNEMQIGIVDVPGHERFVHNMVAGVSGVDFVLLVVAADEGVMPQTREHLEICSLLGIKKGLVVITKADLARGDVGKPDQPDLLDVAIADVRDFLAGTFLEGAPVIPFSAMTGQGKDELLLAISDLAKSKQNDSGQAEGAEGIWASKQSDLLRLPVDRVFTLKGHGTVVTGTLISGNVTPGEEVELLPAGLTGRRTARVRAIQSHGKETACAMAGQRTSINLAGLETQDIDRGDTLTRPDTLRATDRWLISLTCLGSAPRPLKNRKEIHFHHGTREIMGRLLFFDRDQLLPGETALAEIRFAAPMAGIFGDHFIIRAFSPLRTVAGGEIRNPQPRPIKRKDFSAALQIKLQDLPNMTDSELALTQLEMAGPHGAAELDLAALTGLASARLSKTLSKLAESGQAFCYNKADAIWISAAHLTEAAHIYLRALADFHTQEPLKAGLPKGALFCALGRNTPPKLAQFVLERLLKSKELLAENELLKLPSHNISPAANQSALCGALLAILNRDPLIPPSFKELLTELQVTRKEGLLAISLLSAEGRLVKISEELYFTAEAVMHYQNLALEWLGQHDDLTPGDFKEISGLTRKYLIPLLEYFDRARLTIRIGDKRQLRGHTKRVAALP